MTVELYKKTGTYFSEKDNKDKPFTNFYIKCNDNLIPIEVKYFPNAQLDNRDPGYQGRFAVLSAFAEILPEVEKKSSINPHKVACPKCKSIMRVDDRDGNEYYLGCDKCNISAFVDTKSGEITFTDSDGTDLPF